MQLINKSTLVTTTTNKSVWQAYNESRCLSVDPLMAGAFILMCRFFEVVHTNTNGSNVSVSSKYMQSIFGRAFCAQVMQTKVNQDCPDAILIQHTNYYNGAGAGKTRTYRWCYANLNKWEVSPEAWLAAYNDLDESVYTLPQLKRLRKVKEVLDQIVLRNIVLFDIDEQSVLEQLRELDNIDEYDHLPELTIKASAVPGKYRKRTNLQLVNNWKDILLPELEQRNIKVTDLIGRLLIKKLMVIESGSEYIVTVDEYGHRQHDILVNIPKWVWSLGIIVGASGKAQDKLYDVDLSSAHQQLVIYYCMQHYRYSQGLVDVQQLIIADKFKLALAAGYRQHWASKYGQMTDDELIKIVKHDLMIWQFDDSGRQHHRMQQVMLDIFPDFVKAVEHLSKKYGQLSQLTQRMESELMTKLDKCLFPWKGKYQRVHDGVKVPKQLVATTVQFFTQQADKDFIFATKIKN